MGKTHAAPAAVLRAVFALAAIAATLMWGRMAQVDAAPAQLMLPEMPTMSTVDNPPASRVPEVVVSEDVSRHG